MLARALVRMLVSSLLFDKKTSSERLPSDNALSRVVAKDNGSEIRLDTGTIIIPAAIKRTNDKNPESAVDI